MSKKTDAFISVIAPIAQKEYRSRAKWILPSVCIAQAALESGWNVNAKTLFGIKGKGNNLTTQEFVNGHYVTVNADFRSYSSVEEAVKDYYDLLTTNKRYKAAVNNPDWQSTVKAIKAGGYATSPDYVDKVSSIIVKYCLTAYDKKEKLSVDEVAQEVINGKWGNTPKRKAALEAAGYNYSEVQAAVNVKLGKPVKKSTKKTYEEVAKEVIAGKWGNGTARRLKLQLAGYNYSEVQAIVNRLAK